ncbi:MAG TPA: P-type conjugative transfer protein TrbG, partial [Caulobacteraceae bacterium]|nr:P-type conjugative transfer protein TrbG [Caulobacteraceae bacterium]
AEERHVISANAGARSYPTPDAYINATLYYDYEAGRLYEINTSPHFLTAIILRPGEKLLSKAAGDTVRWVMGETAQGAGAGQQVVVLLKPIRGGLRTNIVLTTDQRTYLIEASSRDGGAYTSAVSWNYPQEQMQALAAAQAAEQANLVAQAAVPIDQLHFGYKIQPIHGKPPSWQPLRVFDDGTRTYIQFPVNMASTDAPPLFLIGPHDAAELVNYRYINGYYVVDRLIDVAELRIGEKPQTIVRITRAQGQG